MSYRPDSVGVAQQNVPSEVLGVLESLAESVHDRWAAIRFDEGWTFGATLDADRKTHPCLVPYSELSEAEKQRDRASVLQTVSALVSCGFEIRRTS